MVSSTEAMDQTIVRAAIHPAIGVARVGNSPDEFFYGPEVPYPAAAAPGFYRDRAGAMKRQAARFRVYGLNAAGEAVRELTADNAEIVWAVDVANKKAEWFNFTTAMDLPQATPCGRRNGFIIGASRAELAIRPGPRSIYGVNQAGVAFDTGKFLGVPVYLGELRTDDAGRLVFLGGRGIAASPFEHNPLSDFCNNDGWYDDTADGSVSAVVKIGGKPIPVASAWVVVAPPNFAPDIISVQTMYDIVYDACSGGWLIPPKQPSFTEHIYPLLRQFNNCQWVNNGFATQFGWGAPNDFLRPDLLAKLSQRGDTFSQFRNQIFQMFINPADPAGASFSGFPIPAGFSPWPSVFGDVPSVPPGHFLSLTATQYGFLQQWATGKFVADWDPDAALPRCLSEVPLEQQPDALNKAALFYCMGGPFHPGGEMPWVMRQGTIYRGAFRIRPRAPGEVEPELGDILTPAAIQNTSSNRNLGPLYFSGPGDITRWLAVPWQADSANCRGGFDYEHDPYLPTFWPARVPNDVLTEESYLKVMDSSLPIETRMDAFYSRARWYRWLGGAANDQMNQLASDFSKLGIVERRDPPADGDFPESIYVESLPQFEGPPPNGHEAFMLRPMKVRRLRRR
jgi:hypothetical protein